MDRHSVVTRSVVWVVAIALVSACSTTRQIVIADSRPLTEQVKVGDRVEIEKKDGVLLKFRVSEVSPEGLRGGNVFVPTEDIGQARVIEGSDPVSSIGAVVLWAVIVGLVLWEVSGLSGIRIER